MRYGIRVVNLSRDRHEVVTTTIAGKSVSVELPRLLFREVGVFVALPVPKVHALTVASLGFKNRQGCLDDKMRVFQHPQFGPMILATNRTLQSKLRVSDGSYSLDFTGPMASEVPPEQAEVPGNAAVPASSSGGQ